MMTMTKIMNHQENWKKAQEANKHVAILNKKLKASREKTRRLKIKVKSLKAVTKQLREKNLITSSCGETLERDFSSVPLTLLKRMNSNSGKGCKYSPCRVKIVRINAAILLFQGL